MKTMLLTKLKTATVVLVVVGGLFAGAGLRFLPSNAAHAAQGEQATQREVQASSKSTAQAQNVDALVQGYIAARLLEDQAAEAQFFHRVYLDILGILPTADEVREYLNDQDPGKRSKLIDRLLNDPANTRRLLESIRKILDEQTKQLEAMRKQVDELRAFSRREWIAKDILMRTLSDMYGNPLISRDADQAASRRLLEAWIDPQDKSYFYRPFQDPTFRKIYEEAVRKLITETHAKEQEKQNRELLFKTLREAQQAANWNVKPNEPLLRNLREAEQAVIGKLLENEFGQSKGKRMVILKEHGIPLDQNGHIIEQGGRVMALELDDGKTVQLTKKGQTIQVDRQVLRLDDQGRIRSVLDLDTGRETPPVSVPIEPAGKK